MSSTSILERPINKQDIIFYYLYDNGEQTSEKLVEVGDIESKNAFSRLVQRQKENIIISRKDGTTHYYNISPELREQIALKIKHKQESLDREKEEEIKQRANKRELESEIQEYKNILSTNNSTFKRKEKDLILNIQELSEGYPKLYESFLNEPVKVKEAIIKIALKDFGFEKLNLRFGNFSEIMNPKRIESLRSEDIDKLQLIKARVSLQTDVRPQIVNAKFECPSCGTIISVLQVEKKFREPTRCSCGRRGGFRVTDKTLIDRAKVDLQDLNDLTESPQTRELSAMVYNHLTESKELSKLNPGNEVKVLCVLREVPIEKGGNILTSLDLVLEIFEVEPFEEVIDLDSFEEEEIKQFQEVAAKISEKNSLLEVRNSFAPDIVGNDSPKDCLILKSAQGRGRKNKSNTLFISNPGLAKSVLVKRYKSLVPGSSYVSGSGSSVVGLTATVEKKEEGWVCKPGVLPTTKEDAIIDEFNLINEEERPKLQEAMSEGVITINKASIHTQLKSECGIVAAANPRNGVFDELIRIEDQFNIPPQIMNRFDAIFKIDDTKSSEEDEKIARQMMRRKENKIEQKYSDDFLKRFFLYVRSQSEPEFPEELIERYIPEKYAEIRRNARLERKEYLINARFVESITRFSVSMAKLKLKSKVSKEDVDFVLNFLKNTYFQLKSKEEVAFLSEKINS